MSRRDLMTKPGLLTRVCSAVGLLLAAATVMLAAACGESDDRGRTETDPTATAVTVSSLPPAQIILNRARQVISSSPGEGSPCPNNLITADQLSARLADPEQAAGMFLLDTRPRNEWDEQGHIDGATWMQMQDVADPENLERLPKDKQIVCLSPTGHTAVQVMSILRMLGYDAAALEFGYAGWMQGPGNQLIAGDVQNGMAKRYPIVKEPPYTAPVPQQPTSALGQPAPDEFPILQQATMAFLQGDIYDQTYPFNNIFADNLYADLAGAGSQDPYFLLDIRSLDIWLRDGHIDMGSHLLVDWRVLLEPQNLQELPHDKPVIVVDRNGQTAGQVTPILRMLGYNALTLRSGMTAWTETGDSATTLGLMQAANYPVVN